MRPALVLLLLATCLPVAAEDEQEPPFSYLFLDAAFTRDRDRTTGLISDGFRTGGSVDLSDHAYFVLGYSRSGTGPVESQPDVTRQADDDSYTAGFGGHRPLTEKTDLTTSLSYIQSRTRVRQPGAQDAEDRREGASASVGLRHLLHPWVELSLGPSYSFVAGDRGWDAAGGLGLKMTRKLWLDVGMYRSAQESDGWWLGLRTVLGGD